jgi:hypothetical protein
MRPLTAANPPEDIEAVLGRFQAWSATRKLAVRTPHKSGDLPEGVRELSYEEALESGRYRWQARVRPSESDESKSDTDTAAKQNPPAAQATPLQTSFDDRVLPDKLSLSPAQPHLAKNLPQEHAPTFNAVLADALPAEPDPSALALIWPAASKNERQVSMSLRVAASEQALIKARAAEAGLSVSAYLRHCALEVEKLRAQVHHTLALMEQGSEHRPVRSLPADPPPMGFLARLSRRIFGTPARPSLRALTTAGSPRPPAHAG